MPDLATLAAAVTAVAVSLPPAHVPPESPLYEAPAARTERLAVVGSAVAEAAARARCEAPWGRLEGCRPIWPGSTVELAGVLLGTAYLESGLALHVHAGRCRVAIGECDAGRARSLWQLQRTKHVWHSWRELEGVGEWSTFSAAWGATRALSAARQYCSRRSPQTPWLEATVAAYARGYSCTWRPAARRARFIVSVEQRIRSELAQTDS